MPPEYVSQERDLVRARKSLPRKISVRGVISRAGNNLDGDLFGKDGRAFLDDLELPTVDRGIIEAHMAAIDALNEQIEKLERTIEKVAGADEDSQRLMWIPGVSYFTSLLIKIRDRRRRSLPECRSAGELCRPGSIGAAVG